MNKNTKIILVSILTIVIVSLITLLVYSNFFAKHQNNENLDNLDQGNLIDDDNDIYINKEYTYENITIKEFNITYDKDTNKSLLSFKISNDSSEYMYGFYIKLYLINDNKTIYEELVKISSIDIETARYVNFELNGKFTEVSDFRFEKVIVEGIG